MMERIVMISIILLGIKASVYSQKPTYYDDSLNSLYKHTVDLVSAEELKAMMKKDKKIVILDTREPEEYKVSHIEGARLVGYNKFKMASLKEIPKRSPIVLYCSLGIRSELIGEKLMEAGYENVKNLYGGIFDWVYQGFPIVDNSGEYTQKVHAYDKEWSRWLLKGEIIY